MGHLYIIENGDKYFETVNLLDHEEKNEMKDSLNTPIRKSTNSSGNHKSKARRHLFNPY